MERPSEASGGAHVGWRWVSRFGVARPPPTLQHESMPAASQQCGGAAAALPQKQTGNTGGPHCSGGTCTCGGPSHAFHRRVGGQASRGEAGAGGASVATLGTAQVAAQQLFRNFALSLPGKVVIEPRGMVESISGPPRPADCSLQLAGWLAERAYVDSSGQATAAPAATGPGLAGVALAEAVCLPRAPRPRLPAVVCHCPSRWAARWYAPLRYLQSCSGTLLPCSVWLFFYYSLVVGLPPRRARPCPGS